jgi:hypothetical protein
VAISSFAALAFPGSRISEAVTKVFKLEIAVGRLREAQEAELQADCGIPSGTFSVLRADDASRIKPAPCVYRPEPTAISSPSFWWLALEGHKTKGVFAKALQNR